MSEPFEGYMVVVDTDKYAGNFEREMGAFITGEIGECLVGEESQEVALRELDPDVKKWFGINTAQVPDEHGCLRPVVIWPTPGWFNDGTGNGWRDGANEKEVRQKKIESAMRNYMPYIKRIEEGLDKEDNSEATIEDLSQRLKTYQEHIEMAKTGEIGRYASFQSVGIFFIVYPPKWIVEIIKERAEKFVKERDINIEGFRIVNFTSITKPL